jgi:glycosyltransferase 2 family protein
MPAAHGADECCRGMSAARQLALKALIAGAILGLLFYFVPIGEVAATLGAAAPGLLLLGVLLQFVMRIANTPRLHVIALNQGIRLNPLELFRILLVTQYYALLLPGTVAAGGATWMKFVQSGAGKGAAIATVLLNRGIGTLVMIVLGAMAWLLDRGHLELHGAIVLLLVCAALMLAMVFGRLPARPPSERALFRLPRWMQGFSARLLLFQRVSPAGKLVVLASSLALEFANVLGMWCFALAVGLSLDLLTVFWMRAALELILMLPFQLAGLGLREVSLVGLGALAGVPPAAAVAWSLLIFAASVVVSAVGGMLEANSAARYLAQSRAFSPAGRPGDSES